MKLGNCVTAIRGVSYKPGDLRQELDGDSIVLLRANNITAGKVNHNDVQYVDRAKVKEKQLLHRGDILVCASSGSKKLVGKAALVKDDACKTFGTFCLVLRPNGLVEPEYLGHYFQSPQYRRTIEEVCTGSNINNLKPANFSELDVRIPDKSAQVTAIKQMNGVQERMAECQRLQKQLDELVKSRFVEMFGDKKYPLIEIGSRCKTTSGGTPSKKNPKYYEGGFIPWLTSGEVNKGRIDRPSHFITQLGLENSSAKLVPSNTVVVAMYGATAGQVGIVEYETSTNQAVCCIPPTEGLDPVYLRFALESKKQWMVDQCSGGAQPNISQGVVRRVEIPDAPCADQEAFATFVRQVDKSKFAVQQSIDKLQMLYDSLAQEYFGG